MAVLCASMHAKPAFPEHSHHDTMPRFEAIRGTKEQESLNAITLTLGISAIAQRPTSSIAITDTSGSNSGISPAITAPVEPSPHIQSIAVELRLIIFSFVRSAADCSNARLVSRLWNSKIAPDTFKVLQHVRQLEVLNEPDDLNLSELMGILSLNSLQSFAIHKPMRLVSFRQLLRDQAGLRSLGITRITDVLASMALSAWAKEPWIASRLSGLTDVQFGIPADGNYHDILPLLTVIGDSTSKLRRLVLGRHKEFLDGSEPLLDLFNPTKNVSSAALCLTHSTLQNIQLNNSADALAKF
ncbi:hypothetical protein K458DRAFT_428437 [Lentithecium fluviatile CBS 122367]|uniref:F-box domain-containing protein n=1 Tax=Lentithecium fluviatile CBS 122367 TaxID=1168545 RepID=A0A6G1JFG6_9PLEO|nr:hypothetical protein K458DRAFT_428437 [Lentithecium fluviatile CBS 122367]